MGTEGRRKHSSRVLSYLMARPPRTQQPQPPRRHPHRSERLRLLLTNDDGFDAPGLEAICRTLRNDHELLVCAPNEQQSGASHRLTLTRPLRATKITEPAHGWRVDGTPADCVKLALRELLDNSVDFVISGINHGANSGLLAHYSGTVAAAKEAAMLGVPSIAISLCGWNEEHFETAAEVLRRLLPHLNNNTIPPRSLLNINVPNRSIQSLKGLRLAPMGLGQMNDGYEARVDPRGQSYYWLTAEVSFAQTDIMDDNTLVDQGYAVISPLRLDWTDYDTIHSLNRSLGTLLEPQEKHP